MNYTVIGIDFGTSTTVIKIKNYYEGMRQKDYHDFQFNNSNCLPTFIFEDEEKKLYFGHDAENQVKDGSEGNLHENFKMKLIGNPEEKSEAQRYIKEFFKYLYTEFAARKDEFNVQEKIKTYISYPAKWSPEIRGFMKQAATDAGFSNVEGESEPTAAIYESLIKNLENLQKEKIIVCNKSINVMMLDMGAGTSDIAIFKFRINEDNKPVIDELITYPTVNNVYLCGGREIDKILVEDLKRHIISMSKGKPIKQGILKAINNFVKKWKEDSVSRNLEDEKSIRIGGYIGDIIQDGVKDGNYDDVPFKMDRRRFELLTEPHWKQLRSLIEDSIISAKNKLKNFKGAEDIDLIILTGGHSKWYGIREFILGKNFAALKPINFEKIKIQPQRLLQEKYPQETVAKGLVYKDIEFDVKRTMANSLWIQYTIEGKKSEIIPIAQYNDVLPIKTTANFEDKIVASLFRTKKIPIKCNFLFGSCIESAKIFPLTRDLEVPDTILRYIFGGALVGIFFPFFVVNAVINGMQGSSDVDYVVKISSSIVIDESEAITISGNLTVDNSNNNIPFEIKVG